MKKKDVNLLRQEFIGSHVVVVGRNIKGKIIDETKNSFEVQTKEDKKRVLKSGATFQIKTKEGLVEMEGKLIAVRPEDRIKIKKWK